MIKGRQGSGKVILAAGVALIVVVLAVVGFMVLRPGEEASSTAATLPDDPHMLMVGDSYSGGVGADDPGTQSWARLVADHYDALGWQTKIDAVNSTGWLNGAGGPNTYGERITRAAADNSFVPNILVLQGGLNDYDKPTTDVGAAVAASVEEARSLWPGVQVVVFPSTVPYPLSQQAAPLTIAIRNAATGAGALVIDPNQENWMSASSASEYTAPDGTHLTTAGYAYVAGRFIDDFSPLFGVDS